VSQAVRKWILAAGVVAAVVAGAVGASPASASRPAASPRHLAPLRAANGVVVPGRYTVVLKGTADAAALARRHGVTPLHVYSAALHGFTARLSAAQLLAVRRDATVAYVEHDAEAGLA
jgi:hypothetical protein